MWLDNVNILERIYNDLIYRLIIQKQVQIVFTSK